MTASATAQPASRGRSLARLAHREHVLVVGSVAAIGLHIADDNFLQPEPGMSAGDHLVSGLVPLALVIGLAAAATRLPPAGRAFAALLLGLCGLVSGIEAVYYTLAGGPSGDDFTGILSLVAGVLLVGAGVVWLWRARRADDGLLIRYVRRAAIAAGVVASVAIVLFPASIAYVVTHTARAEVPAAILGAPHEDVAFTTSDGLRLEGWFVPSRNGATVIVVPGRSGTQEHARILIRHGYGVLLFDRRGEGASEGDPNVFGWDGDRDLHAAAAFLRGRSDVDPQRIGGIGLSVGGEMLIHAAAHSDAFKAIVTEGASGQSVRDSLANGSFVGALASDGPVTLATAVFANGLPPRSLKSEVSKIAPNAVFFVYGEKGQGGSETKPNKSFYAAARSHKQLWEVPGGQHIAGITTRPQEYERRIVAFFDRELAATEAAP